MSSFEDEVAAGTFAHGFLGCTTRLTSARLRGWRRVRVGGLELAAHPMTDVTHAADDRGPSAVIFGQVVDLTKPTARPGVVLRRLLGHVRTDGLDGATHYAAGLGGRWAAVISHRGEVHVLHDSHAAQSVYWAERSSRVVFASHAALCAQEVGAEVDEHTLEAFGRIRSVRPKGTVFLPGVRTPFVGVRPVIANCRLEVPAAGRPRHRRYWPQDGLARTSARSQSYDAFEAAFDRHVALLTSLGQVGQSLTAGGDSEVTLAALARHRPPGAFTFTYVNPNEVSSNKAVVDDLFGASRRAFEAQLPHRLVKWRLPAPEDPFTEMVDRMWPHLKPSIGAAYGMYRDLPHGFYEFQSTVSETGTVFYRNRTDEPPDARRLTALWAGRHAPDEPAYVEAFEEYIDYAQFTPAALRGYDYHDLFYWEHRNSRWAAEKYQLGDIGHRVLLPFNARPIIEPMLSLPYPDRQGKWLLTEYVTRHGRRRPASSRIAERLRGVRRRWTATPSG